jgi:hypothetical protein
MIGCLVGSGPNRIKASEIAVHHSSDSPVIARGVLRYQSSRRTRQSSSNSCFYEGTGSSGHVLAPCGAENLGADSANHRAKCLHGREN